MIWGRKAPHKRKGKENDNQRDQKADAVTEQEWRNTQQDHIGSGVWTDTENRMQ